MVPGSVVDSVTAVERSTLEAGREGALVRSRGRTVDCRLVARCSREQ